MFTGIVQARCEVAGLERKTGLASLVVRLPDHLLPGLAIGASVALDGVCMTVTWIDGDQVGFDAMQETLSSTTLGSVAQGGHLNLERSMCHGGEIGGHIVSGHIDGTAVIERVDNTENNRTVYYRLAPALMKYVLRKGFVALDGCSLTVASVDSTAGLFSVCYIPETLRVTSHGVKGVGDKVNIEVDRQTQAIVDTVERLLRENPEWLKAHLP